MSPCILIADKSDALACKVNLFVSGRASENFFEVFEIVLLVCVLNPVDFVKPAAVVNQVALRVCQRKRRLRACQLSTDFKVAPQHFYPVLPAKEDKSND